MEVKKAIELYNFFIKEGYDLGSQENFLGSFQDDKLRVELFNFFTEKEGYDLGLVEDFVLKKKEVYLKNDSELSTFLLEQVLDSVKVLAFGSFAE